jgi:hypothetical protein
VVAFRRDFVVRRIRRFQQAKPTLPRREDAREPIRSRFSRHFFANASRPETRPALSLKYDVASASVTADSWAFHVVAEGPISL